MRSPKILILILALLLIIASGCSTKTNRFITAADEGDVAKVRSMLDENPALVNAMNIDNMTAAAYRAQGIAVTRGWTALHSAADKGRKDVVNLLISRGADVNVMSEREYTPLKLAALGGYKEIAELLVAKGALVNPVDGIGLSPLHHAAAGGHLDIAKMLITKGANVNAQTRDYTHRVAMVTVSGTSYTERNVSSQRIIEGRTPMHLAARNGHKEMVELLIASGAKVDIRSNYGGTPLYDAAINNKRNVAEVLIAKGAAVNARTPDGFTPLHSAAVWGSLETAEFLISKGAEINSKTKSGITPLGLALKNKNEKVADLLRKLGGVE